MEAPTVRPIRIVITSISGPLAVSASLLVTPLSFKRLPKNSIPSRGIPEGTIRAVKRNPIIGKSIFSVDETVWRLCDQLSFVLVKSFKSELNTAPDM